MSLSTTTTQTTTIAPFLANPTGTQGYRFIEFIEKYTIIDIDNLQLLAIQNEQKDKQHNPSNILFGSGRCTTALAGLCFATVEQVGLMLRKDLTNSNIKQAIKSGNRDNAKSFFNFFSNYGLQSVNPEEIEAVYYLFRNKITHNLFPKHELGVAQNISNPADRLVISIDDAYSLNVNFLANYIKNVIPIIKGLLADQQSPTFILMVENNLQMIESAEFIDLKQKYHDKPELQSYFIQWLPKIEF